MTVYSRAMYIALPDKQKKGENYKPAKITAILCIENNPPEVDISIENLILNQVLKQCGSDLEICRNIFEQERLLKLPMVLLVGNDMEGSGRCKESWFEAVAKGITRSCLCIYSMDEKTA